MADISACSDSRCPSRTLCYRYTCEKDEYWQSYGVFGRKKGRIRCDEFLDNSLRKEMSFDEYREMIDGIAKKGKPVADTLIEMLDEAAKIIVTEHEPRKRRRK